jgi:hypothetical protein
LSLHIFSDEIRTLNITILIFANNHLSVGESTDAAENIQRVMTRIAVVKYLTSLTLRFECSLQSGVYVNGLPEELLEPLRHHANLSRLEVIRSHGEPTSWNENDINIFQSFPSLKILNVFNSQPSQEQQAWLLATNLYQRKVPVNIQ